MKLFFILFAFVLSACTEHTEADDSKPEQPIEKENSVNSPTSPSPDAEQKTFQNDRFKNVVVEKLTMDSFRITGLGQIFEASFNWIVEDGHNELKSGYTTTDAGAPAWGKFDFRIKAKKQRENSVLHLLLFELSAEDGRRTHELSIPLN